MSARPRVGNAKQLAAEPWSPFENERAVYRAHAHGLPRIVIGNRKVVYDFAAVQVWLVSCRHGEWPAERPDLRVVV